MGPEERQLILSILGRADTLTVATVREDGWPQATVVSFVNDDLDIYFGTAPHSQKIGNIARDPRVSATVTPEACLVWMTDVCRTASSGGCGRGRRGPTFRIAMVRTRPV